MYINLDDDEIGGVKLSTFVNGKDFLGSTVRLVLELMEGGSITLHFMADREGGSYLCDDLIKALTMTKESLIRWRENARQLQEG